MQTRIIVAIDGPAGAGKSTIARSLARRLGFLYIDTGAMYRAVALQAIEQQISLEDVTRLEQIARELDFKLDAEARVFVAGHEVTQTIRRPDVSDAASRVSALPGVREALVHLQRRLAQSDSVVMEGRDIGTVVFPDAEVKVFLDAADAVRAERRLKELEAKKTPVAAAQVAAEMQERDARDRGRAVSPLQKAPDAVYMDTSLMTQEQVEQAILDVIAQRRDEGKGVSR